MIDNDAIKLVSELSKTVLDEPTPEILASHIALKILAELDCRGVVRRRTTRRLPGSNWNVRIPKQRYRAIPSNAALEPDANHRRSSNRRDEHL